VRNLIQHGEAALKLAATVDRGMEVIRRRARGGAARATASHGDERLGSLGELQRAGRVVRRSVAAVTSQPILSAGDGRIRAHHEARERASVGSATAPSHLDRVRAAAEARRRRPREANFADPRLHSRVGGDASMGWSARASGISEAGQAGAACVGTRSGAPRGRAWLDRYKSQALATI